MMRIGIINKHRRDHLGGSEIQCDQIARALVEAGHEVVYLAIDGEKEGDESAYQVVNVSLRPGRLREELRRRRVELLYWRHNKNHLLTTAMVARSLGIQFVFGCAHDTDVDPLGATILEASAISFGRTKRAMQRVWNGMNHLGFYLVDGAVAQSRYQWDRLPVGRKVLIPNLYESRQVSFEWPRPYVVWVGAIKERKRPEHFVEVVRACEDVAVDFLMVGRLADGQYGWLEEEAARRENFYLLGERTPAQTEGIIAGSEMLIHTSEAEGFSNVLIQAWMNGRPTLTLHVDPDEMIKTYEMGGQYGSPQELAEEVRGLMERPKERRRRGENAYRTAMEVFDPGQNRARLVTFMERLSSLEYS